MKHHLTIALFGALLSTAPAALVSIQNASFENGLGYWAHETSPSSWFLDYNAFASTDINASFNAQVILSSSRAITGGDGANAFSLNLDLSAPGTVPGSSWQYSLPLGTFAADTVYTLNVQEAAGDVFSNRNSVIALGSGTTLSSAAASTVTPWSALSETEFTDVSLVLSTVTQPSLVGQDIRIFLGQTTTGSPYGRTAIFDNVRLDATPVPEPASTAFLGAGAALCFIRRRRV